MPAISWPYLFIYLFLHNEACLSNWLIMSWLIWTCLLTVFVIIMRSVGWIKSSLIKLPCKQLPRSALCPCYCRRCCCSCCSWCSALFAEGPMRSVCVQAQAPFKLEIVCGERRSGLIDAAQLQLFMRKEKDRGNGKPGRLFGAISELSCLLNTGGCYFANTPARLSLANVAYSAGNEVWTSQLISIPLSICTALMSVYM